MVEEINEITHSGIIVWVVGLLGVTGGIVAAILAKIVSTLKGTVKELDKEKQPKELCNVLHAQINDKLTDIKIGIAEGKEKISTLREDLVEIKTILTHGQDTETIRYDKHTKEWKEE